MDQPNTKNKVSDPQIISTTPPKKQSMEIIHQEIGFSGPLPPPEILAGYDKILPGAAERILKMAETQSSHRQEMEKKIIGSEIFQANCGMIFAFIIVLIAIIIGAVLIYLDRPVGGLISLIAAVGIIVGSFILGRKQKKDIPSTQKDLTLNK